jgi:hypothetical protein
MRDHLLTVEGYLNEYAAGRKRRARRRSLS